MKRAHYYLMTLISATMLGSLTGCASIMSSKMPPGSVSMEQAYDGAINGTDNASVNLNQTRADLKPLGLTSTDVEQDSVSSGDASSINNQFPRLPNPNIVMYVYPHLAGTDPNQVPVPGYSTVSRCMTMCIMRCLGR